MDPPVLPMKVHCVAGGRRVYISKTGSLLLVQSLSRKLEEDKK